MAGRSGFSVEALGSAYPEDSVYLEVHCTYNLLSSCSYNQIISRVTVVMGFIIGL